MGACWKLLVSFSFWRAPFVLFRVVWQRFRHEGPQKWPHVLERAVISMERRGPLLALYAGLLRADYAGSTFAATLLKQEPQA